MDNATAILKRIGLNNYETSIYIALLKNGSSSAGELSASANVPRSRVYDVLSSLEKKGFAMAQLAKPVKYAAVPPDKLANILRSEYKREFESKTQELVSLDRSIISALEPLYVKGKGSESREFSGVIKSSKNIHKHIENMVATSKRSLCKIGSHEGLKKVGKHSHEHFKKARKRGVEIKLMGNIRSKEELAHLRRVSNIRHIEGIDGRFVIKDGKEALVLLTPEAGREEMGILVKNEYFARSMQQIFDHYWDHAEEI